MSQRRSGLSFFQMVGGVMAALHLKGKYDEYKQAAADDEEGRVALTSPSVENLHGADESGIALLDTEIPASSRRTKKKAACCMCCGMDCSLLWKAIGIVIGLYTLYFGFKTIKWALSDTPTGLEGMPAFATSLNCPADAPYIYNDTQIAISTPIGTRGQDSLFDIRGASVGTITIADGDIDAEEIKYEIILRSNDKVVAQDMAWVYPDINDQGVVTRSRLIIETSRAPATDPKKCLRFDVTIYVPPNLKRMHVASHASTTHLQFAPGTRIAGMEELIVTLYAMKEDNLIVPSIDAVPEKLSLEVYRGWIVGDASISKEATIATQRGDGIANVRFTPSKEGTVTLVTTTGAGRSDFKYLGSKQFVNKVQAQHMSSRNADMYLTYSNSGFNGKIEMVAKSYTMTGAQRIQNGDPEDGTSTKFTHYYGNTSGGDKLFVNTRGWAGLYF